MYLHEVYLIIMGTSTYTKYTILHLLQVFNCIDRTALQCAVHNSLVHRDSQAKLGNHTVALLSLRFVFRAFVNGVSRLSTFGL